MKYRTIVEAVLDYSEISPDKAALVMRQETYTYRRLSTAVRRLAGILAEEYHIGPGDRVMLTGVSKPDYIVAFLALQYLHAVTVPLDKVWLEETVTALCEYTEPVLVISDRKMGGEAPSAGLKELCRRACEAGEGNPPAYTLPGEGELAEILFTTGTTGAPKGAMLTYGNIRSIAGNNIEGTGFRTADILLDALPLCHSLGLRVVRMALFSGATIVLQNGFSFPRELCVNIEQNHCTAFVCVPAIMEKLTRMVKDFGEVFGRLRLIEIGAGSLSYDLKRRLPRLLPGTDIFNTWGSSETGGVIFLDVKRRQDKMKALGKPVPAAEVKVVDGEGKAVAGCGSGAVGRLAVRGSMTMAGYYRMPELTAESLRDGWLLTNDLAYLDEEGYVYMLGRADDLINVGGEKVSPLQVENAASESPMVLDAACIGIPDGTMGQVPALLVSVTDDYREEELLGFLSGRLEAFKVPQRILVAGEIPRNRMKKLDRKAVRKLWEDIARQEGEAGLPGGEGGCMDAILMRHSVRLFQDRAVERDRLELLVEAACSAPSGKNRHSRRLTVITCRETIRRIRETGSMVAEREHTGFFGFRNPPALILLTDEGKNDNGALDCACAAENILVAAQGMGLGACWLNGLTRISFQPEIRALLDSLGVPEGHRVWAMIAVGYPAPGEAKRKRKEDTVCWIE